MQAYRCTDCGETRWHMFPVRMDDRPACVICSGEMVKERRRPGRTRRAVAVERRQSAASAPALPSTP
jgi:hypothetical protein